mmetsp:Transcript_24402/g.55725  ORF Transcript_24402/g.55725 Transcript_24402/m.55725 type:complete len:95 (+) Transcript_24402:3-287(+)
MLPVRREQVVTILLTRPPALGFDEESITRLGKAVQHTAAAVQKRLEQPLEKGTEEGHWIMEVNVDWPAEWTRPWFESLLDRLRLPCCPRRRKSD